MFINKHLVCSPAYSRISSISSTYALTCIKKCQIACPWILYLTHLCQKEDQELAIKKEITKHAKSGDGKEYEIFSKMEKFKWK